MGCIYIGAGDALQSLGQEGSVQLTVAGFYERVRHNRENILKENF
jgi:hypothetical protein